MFAGMSNKLGSLFPLRLGCLAVRYLARTPEGKLCEALHGESEGMSCSFSFVAPGPPNSPHIGPTVIVFASSSTGGSQLVIDLIGFFICMVWCDQAPDTLHFHITAIVYVNVDSSKMIFVVINVASVCCA